MSGAGANEPNLIYFPEEMIFTNPENWPIGVEIHPWLFHARPQHLIKPTTTSLPNHHPVDLLNVNTPSLVNSHQHVDNTVENLLDSFTRQSSYYTTRDLLNILEAKYINNHDHPLPLLHINSRKTWLNDEIAKLVRKNDYNFVFKNRSDRIGGGVGIFIRSGIEFSMINNLLLNDTVIDLLGVNLKLNNTHTSIKITGPKIWTELVPPHLRAIINLKHFKSKFRAFLLTLDLDSTT
ncbi:hypothetical protein HELRODRAFT_168625 [Helobdella robusta]|uniref:Uncharacterized protein n=1 Tax=Helobdella robusta TaxID=6412 RepID=T1F0T1_HELRO|nr:hypothetical protein HELRODRAFT_168625 [Helobdella robusta]ESO09613.1 hypothetical protein HELRODRAFT_168625 [Helobdella robusta]